MRSNRAKRAVAATLQALQIVNDESSPISDRLKACKTLLSFIEVNKPARKAKKRLQQPPKEEL
jgi:hypothetical protein